MVDKGKPMFDQLLAIERGEMERPVCTGVKHYEHDPAEWTINVTDYTFSYGCPICGYGGGGGLTDEQYHVWRGFLKEVSQNE